MKSVGDVIGLYFSVIINKFMKSGIFPDCLKRAVVVPIYKKGESSNVCIYRPVSLLPVFSKIIEKCTVKRLVDYLNRFSILSVNQYGFRKGISTVDALLDYMSYIYLYECLEEGKHAISVSIDFSKAFDTVKHDILLSKLEICGVRGIAYEWFRSYLSGRTQCVKIGTSISDLCCVENGVGPLFCI